MTCPYCNGTGFIKSLDGDGYGGEVDCSDCQGKGTIYSPDDPDKERV